MTDRLDRIEALLASMAESQQRSLERMDRLEAVQERTQQQIDSNARSIAAWESRFEETQEIAEEIASSFGAQTAQRLEALTMRVERFEGEVTRQLSELRGTIQNAIDEIRRIWGRLSA